jgi:hypothetical protein
MQKNKYYTSPASAYHIIIKPRTNTRIIAISLICKWKQDTCVRFVLEHLSFSEF